MIINEEEKEDDNTIRSNALIFEQKIQNLKLEKGGFFSFNIFKSFFNKNTDDKKIINKWKDFRHNLKRKYGFYLFQTMGLVIKAMKMVNKKDILVSEKIELYEILKKNQNIVKFLTRNKNIPEKEEEYSEILNPDEHPKKSYH